MRRSPQITVVCVVSYHSQAFPHTARPTASASARQTDAIFPAGKGRLFSDIPFSMAFSLDGAFAALLVDMMHERGR